MKNNQKNKIIQLCLVTLLSLFAITPHATAMNQQSFFLKSNKYPISYLMEYVEQDNNIIKAYVRFDPTSKCILTNIEGPARGLVIYRDKDKNFWLCDGNKLPGRPANRDESAIIKAYCGIK